MRENKERSLQVKPPRATLGQPCRFRPRASQLPPKQEDLEIPSFQARNIQRKSPIANLGLFTDKSNRRTILQSVPARLNQVRLTAILQIGGNSQSTESQLSMTELKLIPRPGPRKTLFAIMSQKLSQQKGGVACHCRIQDSLEPRSIPGLPIPAIPAKPMSTSLSDFRSIIGQSLRETQLVPKPPVQVRLIIV